MVILVARDRSAEKSCIKATDGEKRTICHLPKPGAREPGKVGTQDSVALQKKKKKYIYSFM